MAAREQRRRAGPALISVALDGTPLLGRRTGVGRYVASVVERLPGEDVDARLTAFTWRTGDKPVVAGVAWRHRPAPARLLRTAWRRTGLPTGEMLAGRVDVFHGTNFVLPPLRRAAGVVTVHDLTFLRYPETVAAASLAYRELVPDAVRRAAVVLTPSQAVADEVVEEYRLPADRVVATPLGVDPAWTAAAPPSTADRARLDLPAEYVLFVGTREPRKDLATLVAAHRSAPGLPPLVLAGPAGWGEAADLPAGTVLPGFLSDEDLRATVAGASVVVLPSRYEGFGLPVLEALACGRPVVASDLPVLREVGGGVVRYFPPGDADALAAALAAALTDPAGDDAARRARAASFTWARCAALTAAAYRSAAGG